MNNEMFCINLISQISECLGLNSDDRSKVADVVYKVTHFYIIDKKEDVKEGNIKSYIDLYTNAIKIEGLAENTVKNKGYCLNEMDRYINKDLKDITVSDLRMYIKHKQEKVKPSTLNGIIVTIKAFFEFLFLEDEIEKDISKKLKKVKTEQRIRKSFNSVELEKLRNACKDSRERAIIEFAFSTGMRVSEIANVKISDIDFNNNKLTTIGKGNKERVILISDNAKYYLNNYLNDRVDDNEYLFVSQRSPYDGLTQRAIEKIIKRIKDRTDIESEVTPHVFRHAMATKMFQSGADLTTVQFLLGHKNITTTQIYAETSLLEVTAQYKKTMCA